MTERGSSVQEPGADQEFFEAEYATFFAPRSHRFETVDFRTAASKINLEKYFPKSEKERTRSSQAAALLGVLVGIVIGIVGFCIDQLTRGVTLAIYYPTSILLQFQTRISFFASAITFTILCNVFVLVAAMLVVFVAPLGAGSGIPELKGYLNGVHIPGFLRFRTLFVKAVGVACSIGGGLICGKQGPVIHAGAIVGAGMSQGASAQFGFRLGRPFERTLRFLRTNAWKRDFTAVGAAIGVAVAFGAPMGGWVWVYEEACTHWSWALGLITLGGCLSGVITVGLLNYLAAGMPNGGFSTFTLSTFGSLYTADSMKMIFPITDIPMYVFIGIVGGMLGAVLPFVNKYITLVRYNKIKQQGSRLLEAVIIGVLTALIRIAIPKIAGDCRPVDAVFQNSLNGALDFSQFNCPDGQYSMWAAAIYNPTNSVVRALLFAEGPPLFPAAALLIGFIYYYFFVVWTYGVAVPAGVFFPGFLIGSVYGRLCGTIMQAIFPGRFDVSGSGYAFLGAVATLAGVTRTISVAIIALEATAKGEAFFGAVVVALIAKITAEKIFKLGIYDLHIHLKEMPFLLADVPNLSSYNKVRVRNVMETNVVGVRRHSRVCEILHVLRTTTHHSFPVFLKLKNLQRRGYVLHEAGEVSSTLESEKNNLEQQSSNSSAEAGEKIDSDEAVSTLGPQASSIITPTREGMQATRFDDGTVRVVKLTNFGQVQVESALGVRATAAGSDDEEHSTFSETASASGGQIRRGGTGRSVEEEIQDFGLIGMLSRDVLLAVLERLLDISQSDFTASEACQIMHREKLDSAWPNSIRSKRETQLLDRIEQTPLQDFVVDLQPYIDPDPLLMSGRALSTAAYQLLRATGARHMLVTNMRSGRVVGIVTRKDILPESINEYLVTLTETKVA